MGKPRRCGRIAGCRAFSLPQGMCARLFAAVDPANPLALVEPALMAQAHHFLDENLFLLVVEAGE